jgi:hypothetical protein
MRWLCIHRGAQVKQVFRRGQRATLFNFGYVGSRDTRAVRQLPLRQPSRLAGEIKRDGHPISERTDFPLHFHDWLRLCRNWRWYWQHRLWNRFRKRLFAPATGFCTVHELHQFTVRAPDAVTIFIGHRDCIYRSLVRSRRRAMSSELEAMSPRIRRCSSSFSEWIRVCSAS